MAQKLKSKTKKKPASRKRARPARKAKPGTARASRGSKRNTVKKAPARRKQARSRPKEQSSKSTVSSTWSDSIEQEDLEGSPSAARNQDETRPWSEEWEEERMPSGKPERKD